MKIMEREVKQVVCTAMGLQLDTKREAESLRAAIEMRKKHIKAELEKPLTAGVVALLKEELNILSNMEYYIKHIKGCLKK